MNRVVITGLGAVTPVGNDVKTFWESLKSGVCGIDTITKFEQGEEYKVKIAAEVKGFDVTRYMKSAEAKRLDLFTQYAVAAAEQAVESSGIRGAVEPERFGVYVGSGIGGMNTFETQHARMMERGPRGVSPFFIPMLISNMASGVIAMRYDAEGPSLPVVTACATSTNAVGEAFHAIKHGYADAILAGGAEASITPISVAGFTSCMALSQNPDPKSACRPFDKRRDGFVMGEGAAILMLEELEHARARGAEIIAEIVGYGNTNDAYHMTAPHPEAKGAAQAIKLALAEAGYTGEDLVYVNAHGTSTPLNDKAETAALKRAFGERAKDLLISSTKSMTGHMLGATGAAEAMATALALREGVLPPTIGYGEPDPECDLYYIPNQAETRPVTLGISTSLGFGGHNACVALRPYRA